MSELEFLTEKDLSYFQDLEKQGRAVIITISDEELLSLNVSDLLNNSDGEEEIDPDELAKWIEQYKSEFHSKYEKNQKISNNNKQLQKQINESLKDDIGDVQASQGVPQQGAADSYIRATGSTLMSIIDQMTKLNLTEEQVGIIYDAISHHLDKDMIMYILEASEKGTDEMLKFYNIFVNQGDYTP